MWLKQVWNIPSALVLLTLQRPLLWSVLVKSNHTKCSLGDRTSFLCPERVEGIDLLVDSLFLATIIGSTLHGAIFYPSFFFGFSVSLCECANKCVLLRIISRSQFKVNRVLKRLWCSMHAVRPVLIDRDYWKIPWKYIFW